MSRFHTEAVIFDFDGVLVESADVKTEAFAAIYRRYGDEVAKKAIAYHLEHAGISRYVKFRHLHETLLGLSLSDQEVASLGEQFSQLVIDAVIAAPWVPGACEFVEKYCDGLPLFVASGTPDDELKMIVSRCGMGRFFRSTHGVPATKGEIVRAIVKQHGFDPRQVLMIGDATADLEGARSGGTRFLGRVRGEPNPFPPDVDVIPDLTRLTDWL